MFKLVQYRVKPEKVEENQRLIVGVFRELAARAPKDVEYLVFQLDDGTFCTFCHLVSDPLEVLQKLSAFAAFQHNGDARRLTVPVQNRAGIIGNYRFPVERK
ncbi:hypothetical protein GWG65_08215 [Bradyrhizobium sp. CSA207]|uniref:hypothetical protein n=1 Tax=Bradyrhizobium sp. CSA207 TaxID=2698826 RepID=UPI0023B16C8D|nr:hypothetical protein [Bradyrhizobium sp. CSA207]MDE5441435.1 hypothetical protein [Bradyrhizobium sp. CSA207]